MRPALWKHQPRGRRQAPRSFEESSLMMHEAVGGTGESADIASQRAA